MVDLQHLLNVKSNPPTSLIAILLTCMFLNSTQVTKYIDIRFLEFTP